MIKDFLSPELEMAFLKNQLLWWKDWAIWQTCLAVLCRENKGIIVHPNEQMIKMTTEELEKRCEDEILRQYKEYCNGTKV